MCRSNPTAITAFSACRGASSWLMRMLILSPVVKVDIADSNPFDISPFVRMFVPVSCLCSNF